MKAGFPVTSDPETDTLVIGCHLSPFHKDPASGWNQGERIKEVHALNAVPAKFEVPAQAGTTGPTQTCIAVALRMEIGDQADDSYGFSCSTYSRKIRMDFCSVMPR